MGRHSAPGDADEDEEAAVLALMAELEARAGRAGRHSSPSDDDAPAAPAPASVSPAATGSAHLTLTPAQTARGTNADLALLRSSPALRAQCIAAVVVPFGIFFATLVALGHLGDFLLWIWVPTVVAGVLVGLFLDLAHRRTERAGRGVAGAGAADAQTVSERAS
jgi:hypothetical protein